MLPGKDDFINIHTHKSIPSDNEFPLMNVFAADYRQEDLKPNCVYSVGLHPWHIKRGNPESAMENVRQAALNPSVFAIGETGLDRAIETPLSLQEELFIEHLRIAEEVNKPLMLHVVRTIPEIISIRKKHRFTTPWIIHGFSGSLQSALQLIKHNCYLSFGKFLFSDTSKIPAVFPDIPMESIFLESDDSNVPIELVYERAAGLKKTGTDKLKETVFNNYMKVVNGAG